MLGHRSGVVLEVLHYFEEATKEEDLKIRICKCFDLNLCMDVSKYTLHQIQYLVSLTI